MPRPGSGDLPLPARTYRVSTALGPPSVSGMTVSGIPLHPLVIHAVVMLVPLAAVFAWALAFVTGWRWLTRWLALGTSVAALGSVVVARQSGKSLLASRPFLTSGTSKVSDLLVTHQHRANVLLVAVLVLTVVVAVAFWALPAVSGLSTGQLHHAGRDVVWATRTLQGLLVVTGLVALVYVVLTGDAGARAVWGS